MFNFLKHYAHHKWLVFWYMFCFCCKLMGRAMTHDLSKLRQPERDVFITMSRNDALKLCRYGTPEYKAEIAKHKPVIDVHYANNRHHPEHHNFEVDSMNLFDMIEMVCDWKAAGSRTKGGNLRESFKRNKERYLIPDNIHSTLKRTFLYKEISPRETGDKS